MLSPAKALNRWQASGALMYRRLGRWATWRGAAILFAIYCLAHFLFRLAFTTSLPFDDAWENIVSQTLAIGYQTNNPPLYQWILWPTQQLVGPTLFSFLLVKFVLFFAFLMLHFALARRVLGNARDGLLATLCTLLLVLIGYIHHEYHTHLAVMMPLALAFFLVFVVLIQRRAGWLYLLLGVLAGLAFLGKTAFLLVIVLTVIAGLWGRETRKIVLDWRILLAAGAFVVTVAPYLLWMLDQGIGRFGPSFGSGVARLSEPWLDNVLSGGRYFIVETLTYFAILGFVLPLILGRRALAARLGVSGGDTAALAFFARYMIVAVVLTGLAILTGKVGYLTTRYMLALYLPAAIVLFDLFRSARPTLRMRGRLVNVIVIGIAVVAAVRVAGLVDPRPPLCDARCYPGRTDGSSGRGAGRRTSARRRHRGDRPFHRRRRAARSLPRRRSPQPGARRPMGAPACRGAARALHPDLAVRPAP